MRSSPPLRRPLPSGRPRLQQPTAAAVAPPAHPRRRQRAADHRSGRPVRRHLRFLGAAALAQGTLHVTGRGVRPRRSAVRGYHALVERRLPLGPDPVEREPLLERAAATPGRDPAMLRARTLAGGAAELIAEIDTYQSAGVQQIILMSRLPTTWMGWCVSRKRWCQRSAIRSTRECAQRSARRT